MRSAPPDAARPRLGAVEILALVAAVVLVRCVATRVCPIYDDAFISYRYARNLARGLGLVFNPGADWEPVLGTTTPGYTVFLSLWSRLGLDLPLASRGWNFAFDAASAWLLIDLSGRRRLLSTLLALGFATHPELVRISAGGMEAPLLVLLTLGAAHRMRAERWAQAGVAAALACTVRPEAVLLVLALAVVAWRRGALVRYAAPVLVIGVAYASALTWVYGSPIPQSVRSKARFHGHAKTLETWGEILTQAFLPRRLYLPALPLCALGVRRALSRDSALRPVSWFGLAIVAAYFLARPHTWGWYYAVPLTAWTIWCAYGVAWLAERIPWPRPLAGAAARFGPAAGALAVAGAFLAVAPRLHDPVTARVYEPMATFGAEARESSRGATLLAGDIGAIGYFTDGFDGGVIYDLQGLTWPEALGHEPLELMRAHWPDYMMMTACRAILGPLREDPDFRARYAPVRRFSAAGATDLEPPLEGLPLWWAQDYVLFHRER